MAEIDRGRSLARPENIQLRAADEIPADVEIALEEVYSGLPSPTHITHAGDGSNRLFVVEQAGRIRFFDTTNPGDPATTFLDIRSRVGCCGDQTGMFSVAFPPDYDTKRHFYVVYTSALANGDQDQLILSRFRLKSNSDVANPSSEEILWSYNLKPTGFQHKGGQLAFGPQDGYLYFSLGDLGNSTLVQDTDRFNGKMLRLDVETGNPATYTIPASNPFTQTNGYLGEIWALGLRQPWRFSFDRANGDLYFGDVGRKDWEEISYQAGSSPGGLNYGWPCLEGTHTNSTNRPCNDPVFLASLTAPIFEYEHPGGTGGPAAVTGGFVYRGSWYPNLVGRYYFADHVTGKIWSMYKTGVDTWSTPELELDTELKFPTFGEDEQGELYIAHLRNGGKIYRIVDVNETAPNLTTSTKNASGDNADPGEVVTYTIQIKNTGGLSNTIAFLTDTIPTGLEYVQSSFSSTHGIVDDSQSPVLHWQGVLSPFKQITLTYQISVSASMGTFINQADLTSSGMNPVMLSDALVVPKPSETTTVADVFLPGTQPHQINDPIADASECGGCHSPAITENWRGSMMSQAGRDPLMWAALFVANQDAPGVGDYCLRCHVPKGWLEGRSHPANGSALDEVTDISVGVTCEICHRLINPIPSTTDEAVTIDAGIRATLTTTLPSDYMGSGMLIVDPQDRRRGPFSLNPQPSHPVSPTLQTDFLGQSTDYVTESSLCGSCHNVDNPTLSWDAARGQYWPNANNQPAPSLAAGDIFPIERTFQEWANSEYATGVYAPQFAGAMPDGIVGSCQDCHMRRSTGVAAFFGQPVYRDCQTTGCLPEHEFIGGNAWVPQLLQDARWRLQAGANDGLDNTVTNAREMLGKAATVTVTLETSGTVKVATVRVINETGHKLPTGYPEGRRMWLNLKAYNSDDELVYESGAYDPITAILTHDANIKVYEAKLGITPELAAELNLPDVPTGGESFHFVRNNVILKDNRIPPRGYTIAAFDEPGMRPVGATYADGQYWDDTAYVLPAEVEYVFATLNYQTSSKDYIDFLRDKGGIDGATLGILWDDLKSPPVEVATVLAPEPDIDIFTYYLPIILVDD